MIKCLMLLCTEDTHTFTKGKMYIARCSGMSRIMIYDNNKNGIEYAVPTRCGFGVRHPYYTNSFELVESKFIKNNKELRELLI